MATIIKSETFQISGTQLRKAAFDLTAMAVQADDHLKVVRAEAATIVQEAQQQSDAIREQAAEAGRKAAEAAIERVLDEKVGQQMKSLIPALTSAVSQIEDSRQDWLRHWEDSAVEFASAIAARIVRREIQEQPELPLQWIEESLRLCGGTAKLTVRLHPTDYETLGNQVQQLAETFTPAAPTSILPDPNITLGGCRVDTEFGSIDQQIESQLARLAQELG